MTVKSIGGIILYVNLTTGKTWTEPTEKYMDKYIGGRGINAALLYREVKPWISPFDPANPLIFGTGTLGGTLASGASRLSIETKSPITGGFGSANSGGYFAPELKYAGYDHIVIKGRAKKPSYLWITDDLVEIKDASHIWGTLTGDTIRLIKEELNDSEIETACIGPAGENLVKYAYVVVSQGRAAARCGVGAVMGSKNLKAIAVRGKKALEVAHPERFVDDVDNFWAEVKEKPVTKGHMQSGPIYSAPLYLKAKVDGTKNFQETLDPERFKNFMPEDFLPHEVRKITSHACAKACFRIYRVQGGPYNNTLCAGFPANDLGNFAMRFNWDYAPALIKAHDLCTELGLDEDAASGSMGWAFECYQRGILTKEDTDGLELLWGEHPVVMTLLEKIAYREGIGDLLAEGSMGASQILGKNSEWFANHIKGADNIEVMRGTRTWALGCVVATRGGTHLRGAPLIDMPKATSADIPPEFHEKWGVTDDWDPRGFNGKAKAVVYCENLKSIADSLGICWFFTTWEGPGLIDEDKMAELYSAATGKEVTGSELIQIGDRIQNLEKAFNVLHAGFARKDDYPPHRFMTEKVDGGMADGDYLPKEKWDIMLDEYYDMRDWDLKTGWQTRKCLGALELNEVADDLEKVERLPG